MPGGIGPVSRKTADACRTRWESADVLRGAKEEEIFYRLALGRVCYSRSLQQLYFTESAHAPVGEVLSAAMRGLGKMPIIEQLHLDPHRIFSAACRVPLTGDTREPVLAALRVAGVEVLLLD